MTPDLRAVAREHNRRDGLAPISDPGILRQVAASLAAWRRRHVEPDQHQDQRRSA